MDKRRGYGKINQLINQSILFIFFLGLTNISFASDVDLKKQRAIDFYCSFTICPQTQVVVRSDSKIVHYGYAHPDQNLILISNRLDSIDMQLTLIHEHTHILRYEYNSNEVRLLNEGLAQFWEYKYSRGVWPRTYNAQFAKNHIFRLSEDEKFYKPNSDGYVSSFFLVAYLHKHFGGDPLIVKLMKSKLTGWDNILSSIHEILAEKGISIPSEWISKPFILLHLAVALWKNDPYGASYGLFQLHPQFIPLGSLDRKPNLPDVIPLVSKADKEDSLIQYSFSFDSKLQKKKEYYVITKDNPINIEKASSTNNTEIFFYLTTSTTQLLPSMNGYRSN